MSVCASPSLALRSAKPASLGATGDASAPEARGAAPQPPPAASPDQQATTDFGDSSFHRPSSELGSANLYTFPFNSRSAAPVWAVPPEPASFFFFE